MNDLISNLLESLRGTSAGTKLVAILGGASFLAIIGLAAVVSNRPDYQLLFTNLDDHDVGNVGKALAEVSIPFTTSAPPAPFNVYVDEAERSNAMAAVYRSGALEKPLMGILSSGGAASVFNSSEERRQGVRKKEWQEMELMLQSLQFVSKAYVRTSPGTKSGFTRNAPPTTASVTLMTTGELTQSQKETVASIVSNGLGVQREHLVISDHRGVDIYNGSLDGDGMMGNQDARSLEAAYDQRLADRANEVLEMALGPNKARVLVTSEWNYEQSTTRSETAAAKGALIEETSRTSERPPATLGGVSGVTSNIAVDPAVAPVQASAPQPERLEKTSDEMKRFSPLITTQEKVSIVPTIKRLSVAFYVDSADLEPDELLSLEESVKASVGFDEVRDSFRSSPMEFYAPEVVEEEAPVEPEAAPNPLMENLLRRGVEIVTALVFIVLLLKTLKSSSKSPEAEAEAAAGPTEEVDPELLARASVDELLKADPDAVSEILSSWARGEEVAESR